MLSIFSLFSLVFSATAGEKQKTEPSKTQIPASRPAASSVNNITQAAVNAGVLSCSSRINQISNFLTANTQGSGALMFLPPNNSDTQLISVSLEIPLKDSSVYASASFAPNQANGCAGIYETVAYWPQKCTEVAEINFASFKKVGALSKNISVLNGGDSTKVFLMPAGAGCVSIKKEVVR
jgi:hypothetical protein